MSSLEQGKKNFVLSAITHQAFYWDYGTLWSSDYACVPFKILEEESIVYEQYAARQLLSWPYGTKG